MYACQRHHVLKCTHIRLGQSLCTAQARCSGGAAAQARFSSPCNIMSTGRSQKALTSHRFTAISFQCNLSSPSWEDSSLFFQSFVSAHIHVEPPPPPASHPIAARLLGAMGILRFACNPRGDVLYPSRGLPLTYTPRLALASEKWNRSCARNTNLNESLRFQVRKMTKKHKSQRIY
jgi:hypothetical protein